MIAVFGGAFDPVHFGHLKPAMELSRRPVVKQVRFLLCLRHPQKKNTSASSAHRLAMLRLIESPPELVADASELERDAVSYTVDSLRRLRDEYGDDQSLAFVLGEDAFAEIESWHRFTHLLDYANLIVLARPGQSHKPSRKRAWPPADKLCSDLADLAERPAGGVAHFANRKHAISSNGIRDMIADQRQPRYCLPAKVWCYIRHHRLYGWHDQV